jgi:acetyl-CoA decarbonylase/synthase complex subunit delta
MSEKDDEIAALVKLFGPEILTLLTGRRIELEHVEIEIGELELHLPTGGGFSLIPGGPGQDRAVTDTRPDRLIPESFTPTPETYPGAIREVEIGATRGSGGTRGSTVTVGGSTSLPFTFPGINPPHQPVISMDVFDIRMPFPRAMKEHLGEVLDDPGEWARLNVQNGADMVTIHLISTDPLMGDRSPRDAAETVEEILQAVDVPVVVGGCGDPRKDAETFIEVAAMAEGERLLLNSVTTDMADLKTLEPVAAAAKQYGHCLLGFTGLDLNSAKELNRRLYQFFPPDRILMDLTTVAPGYGLEYSFSIHERARIAALMGDRELAHPTLSACTNAWAAREAWMNLGPVFDRPDIRGPLWETITALTLLLAGVDLFLMMHPLAVSTLQEVSTSLMNGKATATTIPDWTGVRI